MKLKWTPTHNSGQISASGEDYYALITRFIPGVYLVRVDRGVGAENRQVVDTVVIG